MDVKYSWQMEYIFYIGAEHDGTKSGSRNPVSRGDGPERLGSPGCVTRQTISLIEKGDYNPTINLCLNICYALGYKLDDLFWVDEGKRRS